MVSQKNQELIDRMQQFISIVCFVIVFGSVLVMGMFVFGKSKGHDSWVAEEKIGFSGLNVDSAIIFDYLWRAELIWSEHWEGGVFLLTLGRGAVSDDGGSGGVDSVVQETVILDSGLDDKAGEGREAAKKVVIVSKSQKNVEDTAGIVAARRAVAAGQYAKAVELLRFMPKDGDVVYLRAKATMGLFRQETATGGQVIEAYSQVKKMSVSGTERYMEADSVLLLFK